MEVDREADPPLRPLPGFSLSETERMLEKVKATMKDLAENAKSKKVREQAKRELRDRGWDSAAAQPETVGRTLADTATRPDSIQLTQEQIEYLKKVAVEAGEDFSGF